MSFMKLPRCPYCGKPVSYGKAWDMRKYNEQPCDRCHADYTIHYSGSVFLIVVGLIALEVLIFFMFGGFEGKISGVALGFMAIPLVGMYFLLPLMMSLRRKKGVAPPRGARPPEGERRPPRTKIYHPGSGQAFVPPARQSVPRSAPSVRPAPENRPRPAMRPSRPEEETLRDRPLAPPRARTEERKPGDRRYAPRQEPRAKRPESRTPAQRRTQTAPARTNTGQGGMNDLLASVAAFARQAGAAIAAFAVQAGSFIVKYAGVAWEYMKRAGGWVAEIARRGAAEVKVLWNDLTVKIKTANARQQDERERGRETPRRPEADRRTGQQGRPAQSRPDAQRRPPQQRTDPRRARPDAGRRPPQSPQGNRPDGQRRPPQGRPEQGRRPNPEHRGDRDFERNAPSRTGNGARENTYRK